MHEKGKCGDPETVDKEDVLTQKIQCLANLILESSHTVVFTGAGISTSSGIADFRGPTGVWTNELRGVKINPCEDTSKCFDEATPSFTHFALHTLLQLSKIHHIVSQNVDGLHMRSGVVSEAWLTELHGNIFIEECMLCGTQYLRERDVGGMGLKPTGKRCDDAFCDGVLIDNAVDWDTDLPEHKFKVAEQHMSRANLVICLGTSLRIRPAGNMPSRVLRKSNTRDTTNGSDFGDLVIVNLQSTHLDKKATVKINGYCDEVMKRLCALLEVQVVLTEPIRSLTLKPSAVKRKKKSTRVQKRDNDSDAEEYFVVKRQRNNSSNDFPTEREGTRRSSRLAEGSYWK